MRSESYDNLTATHFEIKINNNMKKPPIVKWAVLKYNRILCQELNRS